MLIFVRQSQAKLFDLWNALKKNLELAEVTIWLVQVVYMLQK
jgi:hypothetical protein